MPGDTQTALAIADCASQCPVWPGFRDWLEILRNVATVLGAVAIPLVLWFGAQHRETRRETLDLIKVLHIAPEVVDRLSRLHAFRKYEQAVAVGATPAPDNPYGKGPVSGFLFDSVIVLNHYEAACVEILSGRVDENELYRTSNGMIIGAWDVLFSRYNDKVQTDQSHAYPSLKEVAERWKRRAKQEGNEAAVKVPNEQ